MKTLVTVVWMWGVWALGARAELIIIKEPDLAALQSELEWRNAAGSLSAHGNTNGVTKYQLWRDWPGHRIEIREREAITVTNAIGILRIVPCEAVEFLAHEEKGKEQDLWSLDKTSSRTMPQRPSIKEQGIEMRLSALRLEFVDSRATGPRTKTGFVDLEETPALIGALRWMMDKGNLLERRFRLRNGMRLQRSKGQTDVVWTDEAGLGCTTLRQADMNGLVKALESAAEEVR